MTRSLRLCSRNQISWAAAATPLVLLVDLLGWRLSFQAIIALHLLLTLALFWVVQDRPLEKPTGSIASAARP